MEARVVLVSGALSAVGRVQRYQAEYRSSFNHVEFAPVVGPLKSRALPGQAVVRGVRRAPRDGQVDDSEGAYGTLCCQDPIEKALDFCTALIKVVADLQQQIDTI